MVNTFFTVCDPTPRGLVCVVIACGEADALPEIQAVVADSDTDPIVTRLSLLSWLTSLVHFGLLLYWEEVRGGETIVLS